MSEKKIILASGSPYRKELLQRLRIEFTVIPPHCDETPFEGENPFDYVRRQAAAKCRAVARNSSDAVVIGSDQIAVHEGAILRKPGSLEKAVVQLKNLRGKTHTLYTALHVIDTTTGEEYDHVENALLTMHANLDDAALQRYCELDQPMDCAGAYKLERLGIVLFSEIRCRDWTAITGLPLITLVRMLQRCGVAVP